MNSFGVLSPPANLRGKIEMMDVSFSLSELLGSSELGDVHARHPTKHGIWLSIFIKVRLGACVIDYFFELTPAGASVLVSQLLNKLNHSFFCHRRRGG